MALGQESESPVKLLQSRCSTVVNQHFVRSLRRREQVINLETVDLGEAAEGVYADAHPSVVARAGANS